MVPMRAHHVSIERGDTLHWGGDRYLVQGMVVLGAPAREITLNLLYLGDEGGYAS